MITTLIMNAASAILGFFAQLIPDDWTPPGWFQGSAGALAGFLETAGSVGVWVPIDFALVCAYAIMSTYIGGGVVKMIRILISHVTGGGGSAA